MLMFGSLGDRNQWVLNNQKVLDYNYFHKDRSLTLFLILMLFNLYFSRLFLSVFKWQYWGVIRRLFRELMWKLGTAREKPHNGFLAAIVCTEYPLGTRENFKQTLLYGERKRVVKVLRLQAKHRRNYCSFIQTLLPVCLSQYVWKGGPKIHWNEI